MEIKFHELTIESLEELKQLFDLYDQIFPIEVRESREIFVHALTYAKNAAPNNFHLLIGKENHQLLSFASVHYLAEVNTGFIVYIATNPFHRSNGIGTQTLLQVEKVLHQDAKAAGYTSLSKIVLETETREHAHSIEEQLNYDKRDQFYTRNGFCQFNGFEYFQPPLHKHTEEVPLHLYLKEFDAIQTTNREVREIVKQMYIQKYFSVNKIDLEILKRCLNKMEIS